MHSAGRPTRLVSSCGGAPTEQQPGGGGMSCCQGFAPEGCKLAPPNCNEAMTASIRIHKEYPGAPLGRGGNGGCLLELGAVWSLRDQVEWSKGGGRLTSLGTTYWMTFIKRDPSCSPLRMRMMIFFMVAILTLASADSSPAASSAGSDLAIVSSKMRNVHCFSIAILPPLSSAPSPRSGLHPSSRAPSVRAESPRPVPARRDTPPWMPLAFCPLAPWRPHSINPSSGASAVYVTKAPGVKSGCPAPQTSALLTRRGELKGLPRPILHQSTTDGTTVRTVTYVWFERSTATAHCCSTGGFHTRIPRIRRHTSKVSVINL